MSYLSPNRFTFAGTFQANVSTVNNIISNYGENQPKNLVWNPNGTGGWTFQGCTVQSAVSSLVPNPGDPILGMAFNATSNPVEAKLVDLDPEQQMVSQVWGLNLALGDTGGDNWFTGSFRVAAFCDGWRRNPGLGRGSAATSAFYQSIIEDVVWSPNLTSPVLQELACGGKTQTLSIKFNVDMHNNFSSQTEPGTQGPTPPGYPVGTYPFTFGRVVGTVGPYDAAEPVHFVSGRLLRAGDNAALYFAPCLVENGQIFVDLGNSMPANVDGSIVDQGNLRLAILEPDATDLGSVKAMKTGLAMAPPAPVHIFPEPLGYTTYMTDAGVMSVPFDPGLLGTIESAPLGIIQVDDGGNYQDTLLAESPQGWFARADAYVYRFNAGDSGQVRIRATQFGTPAPSGTEITLAANLAVMSNISPDGLAALSVPTSATIGNDGWADFTMTGSDPGYPRRQGQSRGKTVTYDLDGQVYALTPALVGVNDQNEDQWLFISILLFTDWSKVANNFNNPTWNGDVQAVMSQYGWLYPYMKKFVDLSNYTSVSGNIDLILQWMSYPPTDPRHMPVTRDFSQSKLQLLKNWKANGTPES
jgi:hypothetical protein